MHFKIQYYGKIETIVLHIDSIVSKIHIRDNYFYTIKF